MAESQKIPEHKRSQILHAKRDNPKLTNSAIARMCGVGKTTARKVLRGEGIASSKTPQTKTWETKRTSATEADEVNGDHRMLTKLVHERIKTLADLVRVCEIDTNEWLIERYICNKWETGYKDADGEGRVMPLFQVKAFLRLKRQVVDARAEIEALKKLARSHKFSPYTYKPAKSSSGKMLELNIPDAHFGKLAWAVETGGANYDTKIAEQTFMRAVDVLLARVDSHIFDEIWFIVGNDLLNSDTKEGTTTSGTPVSNDTRYHKTYTTVRTCIVRCVERLRTIAKQKVKIIMVSGNHDNMSVFHLGDSLECYFHGKQDVEIDNSPRKFKYHQFGKVMLMFTHGDKAKRQEYPLLMATQNPKMFGSTRFREAHTGHTHTTKVDEQHGVRVRVLPALCPADDWHAENGLVGNQRSAEAFAWDREEGLIGTAVYTVPEEQ